MYHISQPHPGPESVWEDKKKLKKNRISAQSAVLSTSGNARINTKSNLKYLCIQGFGIEILSNVIDSILAHNSISSK